MLTSQVSCAAVCHQVLWWCIRCYYYTSKLPTLKISCVGVIPRFTEFGWAKHMKCGSDNKRGPYKAGFWNTMWTYSRPHSVFTSFLLREHSTKECPLVFCSESFEIRFTTSLPASVWSQLKVLGKQTKNATGEIYTGKTFVKRSSVILQRSVQIVGLNSLLECCSKISSTITLSALSAKHAWKQNEIPILNMHLGEIVDKIPPI